MRDPLELTHTELVAEVRRLRALLTPNDGLTSLIDQAPIGIALLDAGLRYQYINPHLAAINGQPPAAHLGRTIREVLPAFADELEAIYREVFATGVPLVDQELAGESPADPGVPRTWQISYVPVRGADGALRGAGVFAADITEQRRAEQGLADEHQQLDTILQTLDEAVLAVRPNGMIVARNTAVQRHLLGAHHTGQAITSLADLPITFLGPDEAPLPEQDGPAQRLLRGERFSNLELPVRLAGEHAERWLSLSGMPVANADGTLALAVLTARDITQRRRDATALEAHATSLSQTNAELGRMLRLKDEFLAMMSHELRTPLNAVLGFTEALAEEVYGPITDRQRQALLQVGQSGRHLLGILSDILDVTRIEAGVEQLERVPLDVDVVCRTAIQFVAESARQKDIRILRTVDYRVEGLRADERRLTQILANLLDNAVKFTPAGGRVGLEVAADAAQEQIAFTVWDTGIGIAAGDLERLFRPFTQVDGKLNRAYDGIGLGLTLVRHLTALHGGSVQLESTPGAGSRFAVTLPWSDADNSRPQPALAPPAPTWPQPPHVFLADADEQTLTLYRDQLTRLGCAVTTTRSGAEALRRVRELQPDIVVLAIQLPELDGLTVMRRLRADTDVSAIPVIAVTALAMPGDRERGLAAGATRYLAKPVSGRTLIATIAEVLAAQGG